MQYQLKDLTTTAGEQEAENFITTIMENAENLISWFDVSFRDYMAYLKDDRFEEHNAENALELISHFTKVPVEELGNKSIHDIQMTHLSWIILLSQPNDFKTFSNNTWDRGLLMIPFEGKAYHFPASIPNLLTNVEQPMYEETFGNWLESMQFTKYFSKLEKGELEAMPYIMALLFRQEDEKVPLKQVEREKWIARRKSMWERVNMYYIWQALFFFIMPLTELIKTSLTYFQNPSRKEKQASRYRQA